MKELEILAVNATKDILEKNLSITDERLKDKKIILVYDIESPLSKIVSFWYIKNLKNNQNAEIINFLEIEKEELKQKLLNLEELSIVIFVSSTNFRLDDFRLRLNLKNANIWCIEFNHLKYIKDNEIKTYLNAISYNSGKYERLSNNLKDIFDNWEKFEVISSVWNIFEVTWGFEDMKQNTWNFAIENRYWSYPIWENFNEARDFSKVNWELLIKAYPYFDMQVNFPDTPFKIVIKESLIVDTINAPEKFLEVLEKIRTSEWEVMVRELWFGLNPNIDFENILSDVNPFERLEGFHISLWKKHNIYRKKLHKSVVQRYHIDIFPEVNEMKVDNKIIFKNNKFII